MNEVCVKVRQHSLQHYKQCFDESFINGLIFLFYLLPHSPPQLIFLQSSICRGTHGSGDGRSLLKITGKGLSLACWRRDSSVTGVRYDQRHNQSWRWHMDTPRDKR